LNCGILFIVENAAIPKRILHEAQPVERTLYRLGFFLPKNMKGAHLNEKDQ